MTPKERMATALNLGIPDRVPTFEPVSYTHLDVYKRQPLHSSGPVGEFHSVPFSPAPLRTRTPVEDGYAVFCPAASRTGVA